MFLPSTDAAFKADGQDRASGIHIAVEDIFSGAGGESIDDAAALVVADADIVTGGDDFDFGQRAFEVNLFNGEVDILDKAEFIDVCLVDIESGVDDLCAVLNVEGQGERNYSVGIGLCR